MEIKEAKERCNELIKEKHANWIGLISQEAILTVLQEIEHLQKENEMQKFEIHLATERIEGELEVLENYSFNKWENHFGFEKETVAVRRIRIITNGLKDLLKEE